jgi:hypothetical protein
MKRSEFEIGEFLYGIPSSEESAKYNPEDQRVFIHNGYVSGDGYGKLIGWNDGVIKKSTGWGNFCWGGNVRKATDEEKEQFMRALMNQDIIKYY